MSEKKHTPGQWRYSTTPQPNGCPIIGSGGLMVAVVAHSVKVPNQRETALANAILIAAAPDMLAKLEDLRQIFDDYAVHHLRTGDDFKRAANKRIADEIDALIKKASP